MTGTSEPSSIQKLIDTAIAFVVNYSFQVVGALIVLVVGFLLAAWVAQLMLKLCEKKKMDVTLSKFISNFLRLLVITFAVIVALGKFGITIAPFLAAIGALAFGASYAISGPLSNYGAGLTIILTRPFVVGNTITVAGVTGVVEDVKLACTIVTDEDGVKITIPNKQIVGEILQNSKENKIAHAVVGISYESDPVIAISVVKKTLACFEEVVKNPAPQVGIQEFGDSSINIGLRYWVPTTKFFQVTYAVNLALYQRLKEANITIPFPQRDVRIVSQTVHQNTLGIS